MQKSLTAIFLALAPVGALSLGLAAPAQAQGQRLAITVSLFHQQLAPHGRWFQHPRHGWAWFPTTVDAQWRPYTQGQWVWTEEHGWYWNSDEAFGWATYHYGRWGYDEVYGWVWIPGDTWGPAWVAFRHSEGHVGWAPLPPETLTVNFGFTTSHTDMSEAYYEPRWVFVPRNRFLDARIYTMAAPRTQNNVYIRQTVNVTNYVIVNNVTVNRSIDRQRMETALGRRIEAARVKDVDDVRKTGRRGDRDIDAYRPQLRVTRDAAPPAAARAKPGDKPRYAVEKDATAPTERRTATPAEPAKPPATPDERRGATPAEPAKPPATRGTPDERRGATPAEPTKPPATPGERRGATPAQPAQPPVVKPPAVATPAEPAKPPATRGTPDERRGATPAEPAKPPATRGMPDERRGATPAQPAQPPVVKPPAVAQPAEPPIKVVPSAPPSQAEPPKRSAPPAKPGEPPKQGDNNDAKKEEKLLR